MVESSQANTPRSREGPLTQTNASTQATDRHKNSHRHSDKQMPTDSTHLGLGGGGRNRLGLGLGLRFILRVLPPFCNSFLYIWGSNKGEGEGEACTYQQLA